MSKSLPLIFVLLALLVPVAARAELVFATTQVDHQAAPGDTAYNAVFPFTNEGDAPITIASVKSSCGCTVPQLEKTEYAPGESGEITAQFQFGNRTGPQRKVITVTIQGEPRRTVQLVLQVDIPVLLKATPRLLLWRVGEDLAPKQAEIAVMEPGAIPTLAQPLPQGFSLVLLPPETADLPWVLQASPDSAEVTRAQVKVLLADPAAPEKTLAETSVYFLVR